MSELFMNTSKVLKDELVTELQKQNSLLINEKNKSDNILIGSKVRILEHIYNTGQNIQRETDGVLISIEDTRLCSQPGATAILSGTTTYTTCKGCGGCLGAVHSLAARWVLLTTWTHSRSSSLSDTQRAFFPNLLN